SRRRHTRSKRDWSSDVCSSDLTVRDPSGAVAPGVKITIRNQGTGVERTTETESDGNYVVPALEPGVYRVEARAEGFRTQVVTDLDRKSTRLNSSHVSISYAVFC